MSVKKSEHSQFYYPFAWHDDYSPISTHLYTELNKTYIDKSYSKKTLLIQLMVNTYHETLILDLPMRAPKMDNTFS